MALTNIVGTIVDSGEKPLSGKLVVQLAGIIVNTDTTPPQIMTTRSSEFPITNGVVNISLEESETYKVTYNFAFYLVDESNNILGSPVFQFDAFVPNSAPTINLSDLVPTGITNEQLDTATLRIARIITSDPNLLTEIKGAPYPRGAYDPGTTYNYGDMVSYQFRNYISKSLTPIINILPTNTTDWYWLVVEPSGTQIIGDPTVYGTSWVGSSLAPTQDTVHTVIETKADKSAVSVLAKIDSPMLTGNPTTPTPIAGDSSQSIANSAFVNSALTLKANSSDVATKAPLNSPVFTGVPTAPTLPIGDNTTTLATTAFVAAGLGLKADLTLVNSHAPIDSPTFTGKPTAPTPTAGDNTNNLATTAFVAAGLELKADLTLVNSHAPIDSPTFTGKPTAPTPISVDNSTSISTTSFVQNVISSKSPINSPVFTGNPTAPTPTAGDSSLSLSTTAFVNGATANKVNLAGDIGGTVTNPQLLTVLSTPGSFKTANITTDVKGRVTAIANGKIKDLGDVDPAIAPTDGNVLTYNLARNLWTALAPGATNLTGYATLSSPTFTGTPKAPTPPIADSSQAIATTAFITALLAGSLTLGGTPKAPTPPVADSSQAIATTAFITALLAASPALGGNPTAINQTASDNSTKIATTAFVRSLFQTVTGWGGTAIKFIPLNLGIQFGSSVVSTNTGGYSTINLLTTSLPFTSPPTIILSNGDSNASSSSVHLYTQNGITTFNVFIPNCINATYRVNWIAIGTM